ncbi:MAG: zinc transporter ZntB [Phycisphaeraceae bacterium]|nr:zinc transporter ZntB [Phycisphaeraceae bacterium]
MPPEHGLITARVLPGDASARELGWEGIAQWQPADGPIWLHMDRKAPRSQQWIRQSGLDPVAQRSLLEEDPRPRAEQIGDGLLVVLRGVNLNPDADPEDMVALRGWLDANRVITLRHRKVLAIQDIRDRLATGGGPNRPGEFIVAVAEQMTDRAGDVIDRLESELDTCEESLETISERESRARISAVRRQAIHLRRYLSPQRDVLVRLASMDLTWLTERDRCALRDVSLGLTRLVEDLDAARDRATVTLEELMALTTERLTRRTTVLAVAAGLFLPLTLIASLMGMNVGGIPWSQDASGLWIITAFLVIIAVLELWLFKKMRWM